MDNLRIISYMLIWVFGVCFTITARIVLNMAKNQPQTLVGFAKADTLLKMSLVLNTIGLISTIAGVVLLFIVY